jgi:cold shock CspA family protein/ribosome-associated translation inhibitor RaiA
MYMSLFLKARAQRRIFLTPMNIRKPPMQIPLSVTFRRMKVSAALEQRIGELAQRLERFSDQISRCHVIVNAPHRHHVQGNLFQVTLDITVPGREITVRRGASPDSACEDPYVALRDAFRAARRKLEDYERERRLQVKVHVEQPQGTIRELHPAQDFGRIETPDGRLIYFHRHSVLGRPFEKLKTGTKVRFVEEQGERGPQASTVHVSSRARATR